MDHSENKLKAPLHFMLHFFHETILHSVQFRLRTYGTLLKLLCVKWTLNSNMTLLLTLCKNSLVLGHNFPVWDYKYGLSLHSQGTEKGWSRFEECYYSCVLSYCRGSETANWLMKKQLTVSLYGPGMKQPNLRKREKLATRSFSNDNR